ncbi:MAG: alpha/beta hydrolase family protein, partial [Desulfomonilaceae bacterium]
TGYQEGKRCPLLVFVYGGALESDQLNQFGFNGLGEPYNMQLFATRGYAVLLPDAPQHLGTPMLDLAKTVLPGVDKVVDMGIADPERMGIMGHSYGGYSVLGLMVQTKRFKAAMMGDGSGDLISSYGQLNADGSSYATSREQGQELMGGTPWEYRDRYIENSPVFYLNRVETPLLIVQGSADTTVHAYLSDEVFVGLRRLGKRVTYVKYVGEDHYPYAWKRENQIDFCNRLINWFDRWIGNGAGPH